MKSSKTQKKKSMGTLKRLKTLKTLKTFKKSRFAKFKLSKSILSKRSTQKAIKKYLSKNENDYEKYGEMLNHFKLFFKAVIDIDNKDLTAEEREKYDIKKDKILDKLETIENKESIIKHIQQTSPDIYETIGITNDKIPYLELIDVYYKVLKTLDEILETQDNNNLRSEATMIQADILDNLVNSFIKNKKKKIDTIDDDLLDMFRGMAVKTDIDDLENMFATMKVEV